MRMAMKTGTYCAMHFVVAITVAYALSGSWKAALAIGAIEPFVQTFAFTVSGVPAPPSARWAMA